MRSTSGMHYLGLDHIRAFAALMVFSFHFTHQLRFDSVHLVPSVFFFPLALLDEGHTGVSLFMTLSGYLFAKLTNNRDLIYINFLWNRMLRLLPLMGVVIAINFMARLVLGLPIEQLIFEVFEGVILPTLPNGGWSITVELHFYILLPFLLGLFRKGKFNAIILLAIIIATRSLFYLEYGEVKDISYSSIIGRLDQFLLGIVAFYSKEFMRNRHWTSALTFIFFAAFYWLFDYAGGKNNISPTSLLGSVWIVLPTIEGLAYSVFIAYYDKTYQPKDEGISWLMGRIGAFSYSIYLLHLFFVNDVAHLLRDHFALVHNFYVGQLLALPAFGVMAIIGYFSYRFIETPFLRYRRQYIFDSTSSRIVPEEIEKVAPM